MGPRLCLVERPEKKRGQLAEHAVAGWIGGDRSQAIACSDKVKLDGPRFLIDRGMILGDSSSRERTRTG